MAKRFKTYPKVQKERVNEEIRATEVRIIKPDGEHDILPIKDALELAFANNKDLVQVAGNATPPVCKVMDYGKYTYEKKKKEKDAKKKQHVISIKELRFRPQTDDHDYDFKIRHARKFLEEGDKVKATVQFRGRDIIYSDKGRELLDRFVEDLDDLAKVESAAKLEGKRMSLILVPNKIPAKK
ncbi:MAG: translation initiation factor IF-3 [Balneolales bacterium]